MTVDLSSYLVSNGETSSSTKQDNLINAIQSALNAIPLSQLVQSGATTGQVPVWGGSAWAAADMLPWLVDIDVFATAISQTNWDSLGTQTGDIHNGYKASTGAQNAEINWDVVLAAGTWTVEVMHESFTDTGIVTVQIDGSPVGTFDTYSAGGLLNVRSSVSAVVAATGKKRLKLLMATKNASASGYAARIQHVQLRRTA